MQRIGGISLCLADLRIPALGDAVIATAEKEVEKTNDMYMNGIITNGERYNKVISIWGHATSDIADAMYVSNLKKQDHKLLLKMHMTNVSHLTFCL